MWIIKRMNKSHPSLRVKPLAINSSNPVSGKLNDINKAVTMQNAQVVANTKYDPDPPVPPAKPVFIEDFGVNSIIPVIKVTEILACSGLFFILFSLVR